MLKKMPRHRQKLPFVCVVALIVDAFCDRIGPNRQRPDEAWILFVFFLLLGLYSRSGLLVLEAADLLGGRLFERLLHDLD